MNISKRVVPVILLSAFFSLSCRCVDGQESQNGFPPIKFLEDLRSFGTGSESRDPYEERIETERHDFTQSTATVGRGVLQVEAGYSYYYKDKDEEIEHSHAYPEMLFRLGITDEIELRFRSNYASRFIDVADDEGGAEDFRFGIKLGITDQCCWIPESGLELRFAVPTGGRAWSTDHMEFGWDYIYDWQLTEVISLYGSTGFSTNALGDFTLLPEEPSSDRFTLWSQSVALEVELTEVVTVYYEIFGLFTRDLAEDQSVVFYNIGVDYYVTDNLVLDIRSGVGLSDDAEDFFVGIGGGYRF